MSTFKHLKFWGWETPIQQSKEVSKQLLNHYVFSMSKDEAFSHYEEKNVQMAHSWTVTVFTTTRPLNYSAAWGRNYGEI